jgi:magnesium transporter
VPVTGFLVENDGSASKADSHTVQQLLDKGDLLWLDFYRPDADELAMLATVFGIHHLAIEDAAKFGQRPKLEDYDDFTQLVAYGVQDAGGDELTDGFFPVLSSFDDRIDRLQDEIFAKPTDEQLSELFNMKRWLIGVRKVITPQRDLVASLVAGVAELPGMTREIERYYRDLYDHLIRVSDLVDSYRDLLTGSMDAYLSTVSNRLNVVMKQLTVIATIFLPLSFLTGFFGENFAWLIRRIGSLDAFLLLGLGSELAVVAAMVVLFRRGWI